MTNRNRLPAFTPWPMLLLSALLASGPAHAGDLSGVWELQTMGSDRTLTVEQSGAKLAAHRVLWPEFEGKRYQLEHLYRGSLAGGEITGELLVREDGKGEFEILRPFKGKAGAAEQLIIDDLPAKRAGKPAALAPPSPPAAAAAAEPPAPPTAVGAAPPPGPAAAPTTPAPPAQPGKAAPPTTTAKPPPSLLALSAKAKVSPRAAALRDEGDDAFARRDYETAMTKYQQATRFSRGFPAELMGRMGKVYLAQGDELQAQKWLSRALRLDPSNRELQQEDAPAKATR